MFDLDFEFNDYGLRNEPKRMAYTANYLNLVMEVMENDGEEILWTFKNVTPTTIDAIIDSLTSDIDLDWEWAGIDTVRVWATTDLEEL